MEHLTDWAEFLGWLSVLLGFAGYIPYFISLYKNETKPHAFSWFIWGILTTIAYFAQTAGGAGPGAWVNGSSALTCLIIFATALFKGEKNITKSDWVTFIGALMTIPIWYVTKDPFYALVLIVIIDALAFYPTFRKSWWKPYEEEPLTYAMSGLKFLIALFALNAVNMTTAFYPAFLVLANWLFVAMVLWRRKTVMAHG